MIAAKSGQGLGRAVGAPGGRRRRSWVGVVGLATGIVVGTLLFWLACPRPPADDSAEAGFARDMSAHHLQAVQMAFSILDRSQDPLVRGLASDIIQTQDHQIGQMQAWLDLWGVPATGEEAPMAWMGHAAGERMPGLATPQELARLDQLSGEAADREFLRLMIRHHQGGAPMAQAILERSRNAVVTRLARSVIASQQAEVRTMQELLERNGGPLPSSVGPIGPIATPDDHRHGSP